MGPVKCRSSSMRRIEHKYNMLSKLLLVILSFSNQEVKKRSGTFIRSLSLSLSNFLLKHIHTGNTHIHNITKIINIVNSKGTFKCVGNRITKPNLILHRRFANCVQFTSKLFASDQRLQLKSY